jgi:hypothetical protein
MDLQELVNRWNVELEEVHFKYEPEVKAIFERETGHEPYVGARFEVKEEDGEKVISLRINIQLDDLEPDDIEDDDFFEEISDRVSEFFEEYVENNDDLPEHFRDWKTSEEPFDYWSSVNFNGKEVY